MAADRQRCVKLMVSYGGRIERAQGRPPRYVDGEHLLLNVVSSVSPRGFRDLLAARAGFSDFSVKYCYSGEGLDSLCDVDTDEDLRDMLDLVLYRDLQVRLFNDLNLRRFRVYLFRDASAPSPTSKALGRPAPMQRSATSPALLPAKATEGLAPPAPSPMRRIATSPNTLWETPTAGAAPSKPPLAPALPRRIASTSLLTADSTEDSTDDTASWTTTTSTSTARATQHTPPHAAAFRPVEQSNPMCHEATFWPAEQSNPMCHAAPVFLVPVMPQYFWCQ